VTTLAVGNRRLLKLAEILEKVPNTKEKDGKPKFYMGFFQHPCGSPACAAGWWAHANPKRWTPDVFLKRLHPILEKRMYTGSSFADLEVEFALNPNSRKHPGLLRGVMAHWEELDVATLFDYWGMGGAKTGKAAAAFIRRFVKWRTAEARKAK
jgi:hypothetical protein